MIRLTVDGATGGEYDALDIVFRHQLQKVDERDDIVAVVEERFLHTLSNGLGCSEVDDAADFGILLEDGLCSIVVTKVYFFEGGANAGDFLDSVDNVGAGVGKIVNDDNIVTCILEFNGGVRANETGVTCDQYSLFHMRYLVFFLV